MDQFVLSKTETVTGNPCLLRGEAANVNFDPPCGIVIEGHMLEPVDVEIAIELPIDALQEIEIECGGYSCPIVVCGVEDIGILFKVDADQHLAPGTENPSIIGEKRNRGIRLEISDRRPGKKPPPLAGRAGQWWKQKGTRVVGADSDNRDPRKIFGKTGGGITQMLARDIDGYVGCRPIKRLKQDARLLAGATAELDQAAMRT